MTNMTLRVHDGRTQGGFVVGGGAGRNIGDIFFTTRTNTSLNGAVEANGGQYNTTDFAGSDSIGNMLSAGNVPYVTIAQFDSAIANNGECTAFGWDGGTVFKVPKINGRRLIRRQLPTADNNYTWYNLYSDGYVEQGGVSSSGGAQVTYIDVTLPIEMTNANYTIGEGTLSGSTSLRAGHVNNDYITTTSFRYGYVNGTTAVAFDFSWIVIGYAAATEYSDKSTWQYDQYMRPMVQLANGATDEAVVVAGNVLADVSSIKEHLVVEFQKPTADNNYTWYRKYADGWVEQGGIATINTNAVGAENNISLPIEMANTNYWVSALFAGAFGSRQLASRVSLNSTTYVCILGYAPATESNSCYWQVSGIAAQ